MKIVFMGTPDFAVPTLEALYQSRHEVVAVVTQPDKPKGRGKAMAMPPVKEKALEYGIPVYQPVRVRKDEAFFEELTKIQPDVIVVIAFGQILPERILNLPKYGCINIHASLLPKYRGAAPIQWAVIDGEKESGVTTMMMDVGLDTGDMLEQKAIPLDEKETGGSLFDKLSALGGSMILSTLKGLENGTITRTPQGESGTSYAKMLTKEMGHIDWTKDAVSIERLVRGLNPWPSAYTLYAGKTMKIWSAEVTDLPGERAPGKIHVTKDRLFLETGEGVLDVKELQLEGKKRMDTASFLRGFQMEDGSFCG